MNRRYEVQIEKKKLISFDKKLDVYDDLILTNFDFNIDEIERSIPYIEAGKDLYGDVTFVIEQQIYTQIETYKDGTDYPYYYLAVNRDRDYLKFNWQNGISDNVIIEGPSTISVYITPNNNIEGMFSDKVIGMQTLNIELSENKFINDDDQNKQIGLILIVVLFITIFIGIIAFVVKSSIDKRGEN